MQLLAHLILKLFTGTHFMWEIMNMLLRGSADYIQHSKALCMIDIFPVTKVDALFPSPRVLNTHCRLDVLPAEFRNKKTVIGMFACVCSIRKVLNAHGSRNHSTFITQK